MSDDPYGTKPEWWMCVVCVAFSIPSLLCRDSPALCLHVTGPWRPVRFYFCSSCAHSFTCFLSVLCLDLPCSPSILESLTWSLRFCHTALQFSMSSFSSVNVGCLCTLSFLYASSVNNFSVLLSRMPHTVASVVLHNSRIVMSIFNRLAIKLFTANSRLTSWIHYWALFTLQYL